MGQWRASMDASRTHVSFVLSNLHREQVVRFSHVNIAHDITDPDGKVVAKSNSVDLTVSSSLAPLLLGSNALLFFPISIHDCPDACSGFHVWRSSSKKLMSFADSARGILNQSVDQMRQIRPLHPIDSRISWRIRSLSRTDNAE